VNPGFLAFSIIFIQATQSVNSLPPEFADSFALVCFWVVFSCSPYL